MVSWHEQFTVSFFFYTSLPVSIQQHRITSAYRSTRAEFPAISDSKTSISRQPRRAAIMCLMKVKEEADYSVPARVRTYKRSSRRYSSPPRYYNDAEYSRRVSGKYEPAYRDQTYDRYSSSRVIEERKPTTVVPPPPTEPPAALPPPSVHTSPPPPPTIPPPPSTLHSSRHETATSVSRQPSHAPTTRTHYVEVEHDADSGTSNHSSSTSSLDDLRSRTTRRTNHTRNTSHTSKSHRTSVSSAHKPPASEYSVHEREKEIRRERAYSRPRDQYETYRYVNAPPRPDDGYGSPARRSTSRGDYWR